MSHIRVETYAPSEDDRSFIDAVVADFPEELRYAREADASTWIEERVQTEQPFSDLATRAKRAHCTVLQLHHTEDDFPETPEKYQSPDQAYLLDIDIAAIAISATIGTAYGISQIRSGRVVNDVFSRPGFEDKADSAFGQNKSFDFHCDATALPSLRPDIFTLTCLRNRAEVPTLFATIDPRELSDTTLAIVSSPSIAIENPYTPGVEDPTALVELDASGNVDTLNMYGRSMLAPVKDIISPAAFTAAIDELYDQLCQSATAFRLESGQIIIADNRRAAHYRPGFQENGPQATKRWLKRIYIATSNNSELTSKIASSNSRAITL